MKENNFLLPKLKRYLWVFIFGYAVGVIVTMMYPKQYEYIHKLFKRIQQKPSSSPIKIYRRKGKGIFPIERLKSGEIPKNSTRVFPHPHSGGRTSGTPYDEIDHLVVDKIRSDRNLNIAQAIRIFLPQYKKRFLEIYPYIDTVRKSDDDLIIDSARKRISIILEKTTSLS